MTFRNPEAFVLLLLLIPVFWIRFFPRRSSALTFPSLEHLRKIRSTFRVYMYKLLPVLSIAGLAFMIIALARPQKDALIKISTEGIAIQMVLDCSGSMQALDFQGDDGVEKSRLDVVKEVFSDFVIGNPENGMKGRPDDAVGIVAFSGYANSKCPVTVDHGALLNTLKSVEIATPIRDKDGQVMNQEDFLTDIGQALAIATLRVKDVKNPSKVIVLLSDGENNPPDPENMIPPLKAAQAASINGIKIYTIGVGSTGMAPFRTKNIFGEDELIRQPVKLDEELLKEIAKIGKGKYFNARDRKSLEKIYQEIDQMEKTKIETAPNPDATEHYVIFLIPGVFLVLLEKFLRHTVLCKVP